MLEILEVIIKASLLLTIGIVIGTIMKYYIPKFNENESYLATTSYVAANLFVITITCFVVSKLFIIAESVSHTGKEAIWLLSVLISVMIATQPDMLKRLAIL